MMGVFDTQFIELPVAQILFRSPNLGCNLNLLIEVAVDRLPQSLGCNIYQSAIPYVPTAE